jgi:Ca2+-binding EF-hand superfamily protein
MGVLPAFTNARGWSRAVAREKYLPVCNKDGSGMSQERFCKVLEISGVPSDDVTAITSSIVCSDGVIQLEDFLDFLGYESEHEVLAATEATAEAMGTAEGQAALKELFDSMDKNHDGKVSSKEWGKMIGQKKDILAKYFGGATPAEVGRAFKRIDANSDGSLSWEEFVGAAAQKRASVSMASTALVEVMQSDEGRKSLKQFFDSLDKDSNGKVSSKEWGHALGKNKEVMAKYFGGATPAEIGQAFKRIDANHDGNLTWEEFVGAADAKMAQVESSTVKMAEAMQADDSKAELKAFFDLLDKDNNGKVSSKEWGHAVTKQKELMAKYFGGMTPAEIGQAFKRIDLNKDGSLSWEEFVAAAEAKRSGA